MKLGNQVRNLFKKLDRKTQMFFGGPPYSKLVEKELENLDLFELEGLPNRKRVCLGFCIKDFEGKIIGYQSSTIMIDANPTKYEKEYLKLDNSLNYVQLKKILVDPEYWGKEISDALLRFSLNLARMYSKDWVVDINAYNKRMLHFLAKHNIFYKNKWKTPKETLMYRLGRG